MRINPGNYADSKKFKIIEYTDEQYAAELTRIRQRFTPLVQLCQERGIAMRIGTNHGSLSDRIMNRYGDTPLGMVESALEFARIARDLDYHAFIFSMKSSNPKVMIAAYRLLVARLSEEGPDWNYPIHLGVTEAGEGEDARIKSAIGIGSLLADGIGDTIRVSLTEDSIHEIPVAKALVESVAAGMSPQTRKAEISDQRSEISFDPFSYQRRATKTIERDGVSARRRRTGAGCHSAKRNYEKIAHKIDGWAITSRRSFMKKPSVIELDPRDDEAIARMNRIAEAQLVTVKDEIDLPVITAFRLLAAKLQARHPILLKDVLRNPSRAKRSQRIAMKLFLTSTCSIRLLLRRPTSALCSVMELATPFWCRARKRRSIAAFELQHPAGGWRAHFQDRLCRLPQLRPDSCSICKPRPRRIKAATVHLKGVKIAIMGCIVNGPGEMADADFGYVGGAPGKVNLYVGKTRGEVQYS